FALSYANRALAYTIVGRDQEAQQDVARAVELGIDSAALIEQIEENRSAR
ncbi:MAG: hypothetical protein IH955_09905, partial [Chloroflexi bacterium]|nr:hypothetical protein [Chloroflexota bacterium]